MRLGKGPLTFRLGLEFRAQVDETFSQPAGVIPGRDLRQAWRNQARSDSGLCCPHDLAEPIAQRGAKRFVGAGDHELIAAARLRTACRDAAWKWHDHAWNLSYHSCGFLCAANKAASALSPMNHKFPPIKPSR